MIGRALQKHFGLSTLLLRSQISKLKQFTDLQKFNSYLQETRPTFYVAYFHANWNPQCKEADKHAEWIQAHAGFEVFKINTDKAPKIANHYSVKAEPEFVLCMYGDEVARHIGLNLDGLKQKIQDIGELSNKSDLSRIHEHTWMPYGTGFKLFFEQELKPRRDWNK